MGVDVRDPVEALRAAADSGALGAVCRAHGIDLMVLFGSAALLSDSGSTVGGTALDTAPPPRDIDVAVRASRVDELALLADLYRLTGSEKIDLMLLGRAGPVATQRALTRGEKLFEAAPGIFAEAQIAAIMEYFDTAFLREMELDLLADA